MWWETKFTYIWVFNTGRGLSITIRLPHNKGIIFDLGSSEDFSPTSFIAEHIIPNLNSVDGKSIAQCFMSHPHADHIVEIDSIIKTEGKDPLIDPQLITCPNDKEKGQEIDYSRIERDDNKELIEKYKKSFETRCPPLQTIQAPQAAYPADNVEYGFYYLVPPKVGEIHPSDDHSYVNGLSILMYLRHGNQTILIPGDITPEVIPVIIDAKNDDVQKRYTYFWKPPKDTANDLHLKNSSQPTLKSVLKERGLSILIAPHHGLESCFSPYLFEVIKGNKTNLNIISEKRHTGENDGTISPNYHSSDYASGLTVDVEGKAEKRNSVSTRDGHHILIVFKGTNALPAVYLRKDPKELLSIVP